MPHADGRFVRRLRRRHVPMTVMSVGRALAGILFALCAAIAPPATATTVVPMPIDALAEQAVAVITGHVTRIESFQDPQHGQLFTHVTVAVSEVLKGALAGPEVTLKQLGGHLGTSHSWVFGSPQFLQGETVLLFLRLNADGTLRVAQLYQGKFSVFGDPATGQLFAYREPPEEAVLVLKKEDAAPDDLHPLEDLKDRVRAVVEHRRGAPAQERAAPALMNPSPAATGPAQVQEQFTLLDSVNPARWFEPDSSSPVTMRLNFQGEPSAAGNGFGQVRAAYVAWSGVTGSSFSYRDGGFTSARGFQADGVSAVSFGDPLGQMDPPQQCAGVLAIGGYSSATSSQTRTVNGQVFIRILEGDVVFNDGWQGCGFYSNSALVSEVATHELGHVAGLGHSADPNATMYAFAHNDGRGASLRSDDMAGLVFIYPSGAGPTPTPDITVSPLSLGFGSVAVGAQSASQGVTVRNDGTANLALGTLTRGGANPGDFGIVSPDGCSGQTLTPGQSCTVSVTFSPAASGSRSGTLVIPSNDPDENPVNVGLSGTGQGGQPTPTPDITVSPLSLAFGSVRVWVQSAPKVVTVRNDGTASLALGTLTRGGANPSDFVIPSSLNGCSGRTLAAGQSCTVSVSFRPTRTGSRSATLVIPSNDPDENPVSVGLSGTGTP